MTQLTRCSELWGQDHIRVDDPEIVVCGDLVYLPHTNGKEWGLFDETGDIDRNSVDFWAGSESTNGNQILTVDPSKVEPVQEAPDELYIYCGKINPHYGHFLINTLSRFWAIGRIRSPRTRILYHGGGRPTDWFHTSFIGAIFGLMGLRPSDFVNFDRPTRLKNVVIPRTSLEEQHAGHAAYRNLCTGIGKRIYGNAPLEQNPTPIYYSKARLRSAVGLITNEREMHETFVRSGVEIVYPECLSFVDQVKLMASRRNIMGSAGSFLHTSIFCPGRRVTCLSVTKQINTNYTIIDKLCGNTSTYDYCEGTHIVEPVSGVLTSRMLPDPVGVAEELVEIMRGTL